MCCVVGISQQPSFVVQLMWHVCAVQARCPNASVYVLCGNPDITREIHMRADRKYPVTVGNINCRVLKYKVLPPRLAEL